MFEFLAIAQIDGMNRVICSRAAEAKAQILYIANTVITSEVDIG